MNADLTPLGSDGDPYIAVEDGIASLWLNRPSKANCLSNADIAVFRTLLDCVDNNRGIRVLVLRSSGPTFCSGFDLSSLGSNDGSTPSFDSLVDVLEKLRVPTIAAVSGGVYGGGTDLVLACDFRIGIPGIVASMPAAALGIHYYYEGLRRYVERLGLAAAKRMFLCASRLSAEELLNVGFLDEIVPAERLEATLGEWTSRLLVNSPTAVQAMKRALNGIPAGTTDKQAVERAWRDSLSSADLREALQARREKRVPRFPDPIQ
jgi:enoyl-CoA hydratase